MAELEQGHFDIVYFTILVKMNEIKLKRVQELLADKNENSLPTGVSLIILNDRPIFVRRAIGGKLFPVSPEEQKALEAKHIIDD
jgi:hypothetical protein